MKEKYLKENFQPIVEQSKSIAEVCRKLSLAEKGSNYKTVSKYIQKYNLNTDHFTGQVWSKGMTGCKKTENIPLKEILNENTIIKSSHLKAKLIAQGIKQDICEECGCPNTWNGKPITLELHHKNANHYDNRLCNLQILCPNCHSQQEGHRRRKNKPVIIPDVQKQKNIVVCENCGKEFNPHRKSKRVRFCSVECYHEFNKRYVQNNNQQVGLDKETLEKACKQFSNITELSAHLKVSRPTIRKYLKEYNLLDTFKTKFDFRAKVVLQYDSNMNLIKEWPSATDAENTLHISDIRKAAAAKRKSAGGFIWRYKE